MFCSPTFVIDMISNFSDRSIHNMMDRISDALIERVYCEDSCIFCNAPLKDKTLNNRIISFILPIKRSRDHKHQWTLSSLVARLITIEWCDG